MRRKYKNMKFISWNVNGIRACITKGFEERFHELDADIFCLQETKCQQGQVKLELPGYHQYWNYANRRGYSGTAIFTKREPLSAAYGIGIEEHDKEGRVIISINPLSRTFVKQPLSSSVNPAFLRLVLGFLRSIS